MNELVEVIRVAYRAVVGAAAGIRQEFRHIEFAGPRARQATSAAAAVALSVIAACAMHLPDVWWAAISGFVSTQPTRPASLQKGVLRILGTVAGAGLALLLAGWLSYDHLACHLALFLVASIGILGIIVSPHGYAWLFMGITFSLVLLMSLSNPLNSLSFAFFRTVEVVIGTVSALLVALTLAPAGDNKPAPAAPGWSDLLGAKWPAVMHAMRGGVAVAVIPLVWSWFYLPDVTTMATTMASVLAVPVLADHAMDTGSIIETRAMHRLVGCIIGGLASLILLTWPLTSFVPWLLALVCGVWLFAYLQESPLGVGYVGLQAAIVFIMTLVQGEAPPNSIMPGLNRFAGILLGMITLFVVCMVLQPASRPQHRPAQAG